MKTIATKMMAQITTGATELDNFYIDIPLIISFMIIIVFMADLFIYCKMLIKRMEIKRDMRILEKLTDVEKMLTNKVSDDTEKVMNVLQKALNGVNHDIENYRGLGRPFLRLLGIK